MGAIEDLLGSLSGGDAATTPRIGLVMQAVIANEEGSGPGLDGLLAKLRAGGLGPTVDSWLGAGSRQPVSATALHAALGDDTVRDLATRAGVSPDEVVAELAQHLPGIVARTAGVAR